MFDCAGQIEFLDCLHEWCKLCCIVNYLKHHTKPTFALNSGKWSEARLKLQRESGPRKDLVAHSRELKRGLRHRDSGWANEHEICTTITPRLVTRRVLFRKGYLLIRTARLSNSSVYSTGVQRRKIFFDSSGSPQIDFWIKRIFNGLSNDFSYLLGIIYQLQVFQQLRQISQKKKTQIFYFVLCLPQGMAYIILKNEKQNIIWHSAR